MEAAIQAVPVTQEPLHVVQYRGEHFLIYTNWIEPEVWTLYHEHRNDLLAVIVADTVVASQSPHAVPREQAAPAGTVAFFPYADAPFVHRVGTRGSTAFINIGLEFRDPLATACADKPPHWNAAPARALAANRRGQAYHLSLPAGAEVTLPPGGRGLLLAPLDTASLQIDNGVWNAAIGDFRFYDRDRPTRLRNSGAAVATLVVFDAC
jgi:hypothetical protein